MVCYGWAKHRREILRGTDKQMRGAVMDLSATESDVQLAQHVL